MGVGGIAAVILGVVADAVDLRLALTLSVIAPALGVLLCLQLPAPTRPFAGVQEPARPLALTAD
jgi:hypothetical protein